jgi:hypothetical protein
MRSGAVHPRRRSGAVNLRRRSGSVHLRRRSGAVHPRRRSGAVYLTPELVIRTHTCAFSKPFRKLNFGKNNFLNYNINFLWSFSFFPVLHATRAFNPERF